MRGTRRRFSCPNGKERLCRLPQGGPMGSGFPGSSGASRRGGPASGLKTEGRTALCKKNHKVVGIVSGFEKKIRWVLLPSRDAASTGG